MYLLNSQLKDKYQAKQSDLKEIGPAPRFPRIVKIDICNTCNYNCIFCPQAKQFKKVGCIDNDLCKKIIKDAFEAGARELCLSMTGEPLLNNHLEEYIIYAKKLGYEYVFLNTNGYLADDERGKSLINAGIDSIKFSVNSSLKSYFLVHGVDGYEKVIHNIKAMDRYRKQKVKGGGCKLYVSYVAVKQTLQEISEVKSSLSGFVDDIIVMNANNRGGAAKEIENELYAGDDEYSFKFPCSQLFNNAYVTAEGYLIICCQDFENITVVADLHYESISEAWNNKKFTDFRERYLAKDLKGTLCYNCLNAASCPVEPLDVEKAYYEVSEFKVKDLHRRIDQLKNLK